MISFRYYRSALIVAMAFVFSATAIAADTTGTALDSLGTDPDGGILYGRGYAYYLHAAEGWRMHDQLAQRLGVNAAFIPAQSTLETATVMIQSGVWYKDDSLSLTDIINAYSDAYRREHPGGTVEPGDPLTTSQGDTVEVRSCSAESDHVVLHISFHDTPKIVVWLLLMSRGQPDEGMAAFAETVRSYRWITSSLNLGPTSK